VFHYFDRLNQSLYNLGYAPTGYFRIAGDSLMFLADEARNGNADYNQDGDTDDEVPHVVNVRSGVVTNTGRDVWSPFPFVLHENTAVFIVEEYGQGRTDLNKDGDLNDRILHTFDLATGTVWNSTLQASYTLRATDGVVAFGAIEHPNSGDYNDDGDMRDTVLHELDLRTGALRNEGLVVGMGAFEMIGSRLEFAVNEEGAGLTDLNGDGDTDDEVLFVQDLHRGAPVNTGWTNASQYEHWHFPEPEAGDAERSFLFQVAEADQGSTDLNGDGDATDIVLCLGRLR